MQYIVVPMEGWRSQRMSDFAAGRPMREIVRRARAEAAATGERSTRPIPRLADAHYALLASLSADGPKVLDMSPATARQLREEAPSTLVEPNLRVEAAVRPAVRIARVEAWKPGPDDQRLRVRVVDEAGAPVAGARVLAYADAHEDRGASRNTGSSGLASFALPSDISRIPRLQVLAPAGYRSIAKVRVATNGEIQVALQTIDPATMRDALSSWREGLDPRAGQGVRVGVVDTGVDTRHPDLAHVAAVSVYGYDEVEGFPHPHANQVAGIIGARGPVFRGLAPEAELHSYRITPLGKRESDAFHLGEGVARAARDNDLHLINISMVQSKPAQYLAKAAAEAYQQGAVCIAAAGNDGRDQLSYPAAAKRVVAVTAFGDRSALAADAIELTDLTAVTSSSRPDLFRARFSNWGPETDFIAPGVGLISCQGQSGYTVDSGTSFAAPVVTGLAAAMLSKHYPTILAMPKGPQRAAAITKALLDRGLDLGFAFETQGIGMVNG